MKKIVIQPGGYHPFHAGHYSLYKAAEEKFPDADVYLAATNDTKTRPFPFEIKKKLAQLAGVKPEQFVQVNSPFKAKEITQKYNPNEDVLIFVRSEKDKNEEPIPGITKKDGSPSYFQPYDPDNLQPFSKHAYIEYLPTIEFGPGIKSATEIRNSWPSLSDRQKLAMVLSLYPATQKNKKLADLAVKMLDAGIVGDQVTEDKEEKQKYDIDPSEISATGDERELLAFLRRYYPESRTTLGAFIKFVLHSLEHSKEDSEKQESEINKLKQILKKIEHRLNSVEAQSQLQNVTEAFNKPYKAKWEKGEFGDYDALVKLPDGTNLSIMFNNEGDDTWQIEFYRGNTQEITGEGDAQRIFATVLDAIQKFIKKQKPWRVTFSASKEVDPDQNSESRAKLYDRLVARYASAWGYDEYKEDHGDTVIYELTRLEKQGVEEAYSDDTEEKNKNLRYSRNRSPVAADIRNHLGMTGSSDEKETDKEQDVDEATLVNDPENLAELFDTSMKIRWSGSNLSYKDSYFTASNGVKYRIILSNPDFGPRDLTPGSFFKNLKKSVLDNAKYLEFLQITKDYESTTGIEGTGAAAEVFGVVANAIIRYIQDDKPSMIYFQAKEPNRVRLYRSMIKMILSKLPGWEFKEVTGKKTKMLGNFAIYNSNLINDQQGVEEATLINDPEQGHLIVPDGGMGTWDEQSLLSNLTRKFSSMVEMIKEKRYSNLYHSLYEAGVVENMLKALIEYENFKEKQGNRPIAKNRSVDMSQVKESTDYIQEK